MNGQPDPVPGHINPRTLSKVPFHLIPAHALASARQREIENFVV